MGNGQKISPVTIVLLLVVAASYWGLSAYEGPFKLVFAAAVAAITGLYIGIVIAEADEAHEPDKEFPKAFVVVAYLFLGGLAFYFWTTGLHGAYELWRTIPIYLGCFGLGACLWLCIKPKPKKDTDQ